MSTTHADLRAALVTLIEALTVSGDALVVSDESDALQMYATEWDGRHVAIAVDEAPGDEWGGVREYVVTLSAAEYRGCDEPAARSSISALARSLRTAVLATNALVSAEAQVIDAEVDTIAREGDAIILRQRYQIHAVS